MDKSRIKREYSEPMIPFRLKAPFQPMGDQPKAVKSLVKGLNDGQWAQVLMGATDRENVYYGKNYRGSAAPHADYFTQ